MTINFKKLALAAITLSGISLAALGVTSAPAAARTVCDWDGDDCRYVPSYYDRHSYDGDWRRDWRDDWRARRAWEERREHEAYRRYYWNRPYYGPSGGNLWFNF